MKYYKKLIGTNAALVFLILCLTVLMISCRGQGEQPTEPTEPSQAAVTQAPTEEATEATEATEEPTEEPTEETTEPTEEATGSSGGNSRPGGTGGFTGGGTSDSTGGDDTGTGGSDQPKEEITVAVPGSAENPYAEAFDSELGSFTTVKLFAEQPVYYQIYSVMGSVLTVEGADAYVVYNGETHQAQEGIVTLALEDDGTDAAVPVQFGTASTEGVVYTVSFAWPDGSVEKPYEMTVEQIPANVSTDLIDAGCSLYYNVYGINGTTLIIQDPDVCVTYNGVTYLAENGVLSVSIAPGDIQTPVTLGISNVGAVTKQFFMSVDYSGGTANKPTALPMGEFTTSFAAGNDLGVYYQYTAEADGVVTLQYVSDTIGGNFEYLLYNVNTSDCRTLSSDGVTDEATGVTTVSIQVRQGDTLKLIAVAKPGEDGVYPAGQVAASASFEAGAVLPGESHRLTYTMTVVDGDSAPLAGVALRVQVGDLTIPVVTGADGNAVITLAAGTYKAVVTVPEGYEAEPVEYVLTAEAPAVSITVRIPEAAELEYAVTVVDYNGTAQENVMVQILQDGNVAAMLTTDAAGVAKTILPRGDYSVKLAFSTEGYYYDESLAVLTGKAPAVQIQVAAGLGTEFEELYVGNAHYLSTGGTYVGGMQTNVTNYFIFEPTVSGMYQFTTSNPAAVISYWGGSTAFIQDLTASTDYANNLFTRNVKENNLGIICIIGVTGASECVIEVTRIGDAVLDESDIVPEVYQAKTVPAAYKLELAAGQTLTNVDITAATDAYTLVLGADGYYHLGSETGPVMYVNLGPKAPYVSMYNMLGYAGFGGTSFSKTYYDENGSALWKEDYTACMCQYVECVDKDGYGVYPLTEDLMYMLQQGGSHKGWWDSTNGNFLFGEVANLNTEIAWMFACCYVQ